MTNKLIAFTALFIGFVMTASSFDANSAGSEQQSVKWEKGGIPNNVTLPLINGKGSISLHELRGKVVYLDFWASWCKPCIRSFPLLDELYQKYQDKGFVVLAVNVDFNKAKGTEFIKKHPVSYPVVYDDKGLFKAAGLNTMPTAFYIDKTGKIRLVHQGFFDGDEKKIEQAIKILLGE